MAGARRGGSTAPVPAVAALVAIALAAALSVGCARAVPGTAVDTPRVRAAAEQYRACTAAVDRVLAAADAHLDTLDPTPGAPPAADGDGLTALWQRISAELRGDCGFWADHGRPLSALVVHLAAQLDGRAGAARARAVAMIDGVCVSVDGPLDQQGAALSARARDACRSAR